MTVEEFKQIPYPVEHAVEDFNHCDPVALAQQQEFYDQQPLTES